MRSRTLAWASGAALVLSLALAAVLLMRDATKPTAKLADGSRLVLEGVEFGLEHTFDGRTRWQKLVRPAPVVRFLNHGASFTTPRDTLVCWLSRTASPTHHSVRGAYGILTDEHGCWLEPSAADWGHVSGRRGYVQEVCFDALPRSAAHLRLSLYDNDGRFPAATFDVDNPVAGEYRSERPAPPPPVTVKSNGTAFILVRLAHRDVHLHAREEAEFRVTEQGKPVEGWVPVRLIVRDATGNVVDNRLSRPRLPALPRPVRFRGLCRKEPWWRLETEFARGGVRRTVAFQVRP